MTLQDFMVHAIRTAAEADEKRTAFIADAIASREETLASGEGYVAEEVQAYLRERAQGRPGSKSEAKFWCG